MARTTSGVRSIVHYQIQNRLPIAIGEEAGNQIGKSALVRLIQTVLDFQDSSVCFYIRSQFAQRRPGLYCDVYRRVVPGPQKGVEESAAPAFEDSKFRHFFHPPAHDRKTGLLRRS